ncbi:Acyl-CoA synthetase (AMP-forming)/AMP-acid ligase II [Klenkia marina]|uniref:Acyl-CoA synthetase (AMP-forming)/AMP-acid ligase II n=1 Tax=Klenkia marina TaxID=1960309 RepID=A0A1G4Y5Y0_9ACTN|nr:AMP-binding protein [Klenkia marina]SCX48790.1 Acyl-CoA synthetase (AMP-forming)/AMP-acid ligase II [Klenkia marina]
MTPPVDVLAAGDPVAAVLAAHRDGRRIAVRTSGTTSRPRAVVRSTASWWDSFPAVTELSGVDAGARLWLPGPLHSSMNLFAAVHAHVVGAHLVADPAAATHGCLTPAALAAVLADGTPVRGLRLVVAGDRLPRALADRAVAAGARVEHYYGAAELSFLAWGSADDDLRPFPDVRLQVRDGVVWARSPYLSEGYVEDPGHPDDGAAVPGGAGAPFAVDRGGWATVGDRGVLTDEGHLAVVGRGDLAVLTGGATVLVADVEAVLRAAGAGDSVVVGLPHPRLGQLVAAVGTDAAALAAARATGLPELSTAQRPRRWFHLDRWPVTATGKVDRSAVATSAAEGRLTRLTGAVR